MPRVKKSAAVTRAETKIKSLKVKLKKAEADLVKLVKAEEKKAAIAAKKLAAKAKAATKKKTTKRKAVKKTARRKPADVATLIRTENLQ